MPRHSHLHDRMLRVTDRIAAEVRNLKEEIAALEHEGLCYQAYTNQIEAAHANRFYDERELNATISSLQGSTMCIQLGKKGRCHFSDGKCKACDRSEVGFKSSYSIHAWRNEEERAWQEEKDRQKESTETEQQAFADAWLKEKQEWEQDKSEIKAQYENAHKQLQEEREKFEIEKAEFRKQQEDQAEQFLQYKTAALLLTNNERQELKQAQEEFTKSSERQMQLLEGARAELDKERADFLEERIRWDEELHLRQMKIENDREDQIATRIRDDVLRNQWREEVNEFEAFKQVQYSKEVEWAEECSRLIRKERQMMIDERKQQEELLEAHKYMWMVVKTREIKRVYLGQELVEDREKFAKQMEEEMDKVAVWKEKTEQDLMQNMKEFMEAKEKWLAMQGLTEEKIKAELQQHEAGQLN